MHGGWVWEKVKVWGNHAQFSPSSTSHLHRRERVKVLALGVDGAALRAHTIIDLHNWSVANGLRNVIEDSSAAATLHVHRDGGAAHADFGKVIGGSASGRVEKTWRRRGAARWRRRWWRVTRYRYARTCAPYRVRRTLGATKALAGMHRRAATTAADEVFIVVVDARAMNPLHNLCN